MKFTTLKTLLILIAITVASVSCSDKESYSDLLRDERHATNYYLSNFQVVASIPADTAFISVQELVGQGLEREEALRLAPFYRMDSDGQIYMQVVDPGTKGNRATDNQLIYFRFNRFNLNFYYRNGTWTADGNASDLATTPTSFRFGNTTLESSYQWGSGIQLPLSYLPIDCEVNIIIKSALGPIEEISAVYAYLYNIRYYPSRV